MRAPSKADALPRLKAVLRRGLRRTGWDLVRRPAHGLLHHHLAELFSRLEIDCVLDVGAHRGEYASFLRRIVGYRGAIVSFEPVRASFAHLERVSRTDPAWSVHRRGLAAEAATLSINVTRSTDYSSVLAPRESLEQLRSCTEVAETEEIEVVPLDRIFDSVTSATKPSAVFLKMDTQGMDLEVVHGATTSLPRIAALQTEMAVKKIYREMPDDVDCIRLLRSSRFEITGAFPVTRDTNLALVEFNCVMVNEGRHPGTFEAAGS